MLRTSEVRTIIAALLSVFAFGCGISMAQDINPKAEINAGLPRADLLSELKIDEDGTVHLPAMTVPVSQYLSPEGQAWMALHLLQNQDPEAQRRVDGNPAFLEPYVKRQYERYPVTRKDRSIGGVHVYDFEPAQGIPERNRNRVLIQLHAGAFHECWPSCAEVQAVPISGHGGFRVVAIDYRMAPENKHPAASEDVAAVYADLLKTYPAKNIGIFGCSAGGQLTGMATAWIEARGLPRPGAIGMYCANDGLGLLGDGSYLASPLGEGWPPLPLMMQAMGAEPGQQPEVEKDDYFYGADRNDPMVNPVVSDEVLSKFPPTQIITGSRFFDLSPQLYLHSRLVKLGVEADLHAWEGLFHFFFLNPDVPESRDSYDVTIRFFDKHLGQ